MIAKEEIEKLAALARIEVSEEEAENLRSDIGRILQYVEKIQALPESAGGPRAKPAPRNVLREDGEPHEGGRYTAAVVSAAPQVQDGYVKVKKIL